MFLHLGVCLLSLLRGNHSFVCVCVCVFLCACVYVCVSMCMCVSVRVVFILLLSVDHCLFSFYVCLYRLSVTLRICRMAKREYQFPVSTPLTVNTRTTWSTPVTESRPKGSRFLWTMSSCSAVTAQITAR